MNYTKFLRKNKFEFILTDEKVKLSMSILKDITKTKVMFSNYNRLSIFKLIQIQRSI
jgi:hypothetical protein